MEEQEQNTRKKVLKWLSLKKSKKVIVKILIGAGWDEKVAFDYVSEIEKGKEEVPRRIQPWVRFSARLFDTIIFLLSASIFFLLIFPDADELISLREYSLFRFALFMPYLILAESVFLSTWGTTPGKWFFNVTVRNSIGKKLSFANALDRSIKVWIKGMGLGFWFFPIITLIYSYSKLLNNGITSWDRAGEFTVSINQHIKKTKVVIIIIITLLFILLRVWFAISEETY